MNLQHISKADRDELVRKWSRINITCQDEGQTGKSRDCLANQGLGGFSHGGLGNQINLCYYNIFDLGPLPVSPNPLKDYGTLCSLVGIIIHEFGHANGFAILENHNNPNTYARNNDPVYVMGYPG